MKTRTVLPLLCVLSFLMLAAASGSAQMPLHPDPFGISLDSGYLRYNMNQGTIPHFTVHGTISSYSISGSFKVQIPPTKQWIISTKIGGNTVQDGDMVGITTGQTLPVEIMVTPYAERPDTEIYDLGLTYGGTLETMGEIILYTTNTKSAVSTDLPTPKITTMPNPAGNYVIVSGLNEAQAGYRYEIFSTSGAEVRHGLLPSNARINIQDIPSGAYRLILFDAKRMLTNSAFTVLH